MSWRGALAGCLALVSGGSAAVSQTPAHVFRIGLLCSGSINTTICGPAMIQHFVERGYQPGVDLVFEKRGAQGKLDRLPGYVTELVESRVDLIMTMGFIAAAAAKQGAPHTGRRCWRGRSGRDRARR
jgi:putative tryptophan/tyrosine transport system substrate-binding protein